MGEEKGRKFSSVTVMVSAASASPRAAASFAASMTFCTTSCVSAFSSMESVSASV